MESEIPKKVSHLDQIKFYLTNNSTLGTPPNLVLRKFMKGIRAHGILTFNSGKYT